MKKMLISVSFVGSILHAGVAPIIPVSRVILAKLTDHCATNPDNHTIRICFDTEAQQKSYEQMTLKEKQRSWQRMQGDMLLCEKDISVDDACFETAIYAVPGESLERYIKRMYGAIAINPDGKKSLLSTQDLLKHKFWDMPWQQQRYLLAMNIALGLIEPDELLPISGINPLDHAAEQKDEEMIFHLSDKGAQPNYRVEDLTKLMMKSSDQRSLRVLEQLADNGSFFPWATFGWATDLDPDLVVQKITIIKGRRCFPRKWADQLSNVTEGEKALKDFVLKRGDPLNCTYSCSIL